MKQKPIQILGLVLSVFTVLGIALLYRLYFQWGYENPLYVFYLPDNPLEFKVLNLIYRIADFYFILAGILVFMYAKNNARHKVQFFALSSLAIFLLLPFANIGAFVIYGEPLSFDLAISILRQNYLLDSMSSIWGLLEGITSHFGLATLLISILILAFRGSESGVRSQYPYSPTNNYVVPPQSTINIPPVAPSMADQIKELNDMMEQGMLTKAEFTKAKKRILDGE
jgi:hypothetical protein